MKSSMKHRSNVLRLSLLLALLLNLVGCKVELYSGLEENQANEMLAILLTEGIAAEKVYTGRDGKVGLEVSETDVGPAINLLKRNGLPRDTYSTMGEVFSKDGLISSPVEEAARYSFALSQEISQTLSKLDGVLAARVHLVLPKPKLRKQEAVQPSAAVFLKHIPEATIDTLVPQIKSLVSNSVENLEYDRVSVALFPSLPMGEASKAKTTTLFSITMDKKSESKFWTLFGSLIAIVVLAVSACGVLIWRQNLNPSA